MLPAVFKKILGIHSPSKVFEEIGENTMQGFLKGIENLEPTILKELSNFLNTIKSKYEKGVAEIDKQVSTMSNKLAETDLFTTIKDDDGVTTYQLNNFEDYIVLLEEYADLLDGLKAKGVDEDLLAEISDMNIEDAVGYMQQLTNLNDEDFNTYIAN